MRGRWFGRALVSVCIVGTLGLVAACGDDAGGEPENGHGAVSESCEGYARDGFVIDGVIENPVDLELSPTTGVHVVWSVSSEDPDYLFSFGSGCYDATTSRYVVALATDPPPAALNDWDSCRVGVAMVLLFDGEVEEGRGFEALLESSPGGWRGGADRHAIVFVEGDCEPGSWPVDFGPGYGLGKCVSNPAGFDAFESIAAESAEPPLTVAADPDSLEWCNWT